MNLLTKLRADQLEARKAKDTDKIGVLTALISEASMVGKNKGNRESTDDEVIATIRKFLVTARETANMLPTMDRRRLKVVNEIDILTGYLPVQMDETTLGLTISRFITDTPGAKIGDVMSFLKANHTGQYDARLASKIAMEALS